MRPSSKGTYGGWLLFEKVMQDMRLTLGDRSEQLSIDLIRKGVNAGEVMGQIAPFTKSRQELSEALPIAFAHEPPPRGNGTHDESKSFELNDFRVNDFRIQRQKYLNLLQEQTVKPHEGHHLHKQNTYRRSFPEHPDIFACLGKLWL